MTFYQKLKKTLGGLMKLLFRIHVYNDDQIPDEGAIILCGNHSSYLDPVALGVAFKRPIRYMGKSELFNSKLLGWFLRKVEAFPVIRGTSDLTAVKTALKLLKNGEVMGIFPQGTRVSGDEEVAAKAGLAMFAYKSKASVLPVGIVYNRKPGLFRRTDIVFGNLIKYEDIDFKEATKDDFIRVSNDIMQKITSLKPGK